MPGIIFMIWLTGAVVIGNAQPQNYESLDAFKSSVERTLEAAEPVDYSELNS